MKPPNKPLGPFDEPLNFKGGPAEKPEPKRRTKFPWELSAKGSPYVKRICETFLTEMFDPSLKWASGNNSGYDFTSNGKTYSIRYSCLARDSKAWKCSFGRSIADSIMFFGFRDLANPTFEFCLDFPREKFRNRTHITINDDGYSIEGYSLHFAIDPEKLQKMLEVIAAIDDKDESRMIEFFPRLYLGRYYELD
jgi:hypothetical protein